jgi:PAS domain S-box-containing protein
MTKNTHIVLLYLIAIIFASVILIVDLKAPDELSIGMMYSIIIIYSWLIPRYNSSIFVALVCSILVIIGAIYSNDETEHYGLLNATMTICDLWICAFLVTLTKRSFQSVESVNKKLQKTVEERTEELQLKLNDLNASELKLIKTNQDLERQKAFIEKSAELYQKWFNNSPFSKIIIGSGGKIQAINRATKNLFGIGSEYNELSLNEFFDDPDFVDLIIRFLESSEISNSTVTIGKREGNLFQVEVLISKISYESSITAMLTIRDISKDKEAEEMKIRYVSQQARNVELQNFVNITAHDLQQPLASITGLVDLLQGDLIEKNWLNEDIQEYLDKMLLTSENMRNTLRALHENARLGQSQKLNRFKVSELVDSVKTGLNEIIERNHAIIEVGELPEIVASKYEIQLIFQNLIANAIKYRKPKVPPNIVISHISAKDHWHFSIRDNGLGIQEKDREKIFIMFNRLHRQDEVAGYGFGLAHCKKIVESHEGEIWVEPNEDEGSNFHFTIKKINADEHETN